MKIIKFFPFFLIFVGTFGLLITELFVVANSRCLTMTFAILNAIGLVILIPTLKKAK